MAENVDVQAAVKAANEALVLIRKDQDRSGEVSALLLFSQALAAQAMKEAASAADAARTLTRLGGKAVKVAQDALKVAKRLGNRHVIADAMYNVSNMQMVAAQFDESLVTADACALSFRELHDKPGEIAAVLLRAEVHSLTGRKEQAKDLAIRAVASAKDCNDAAGELRAVVLLERLAGQQQQKPETQEEQTVHVEPSTKKAEEAAPTLSHEEVETIVLACARDATGDGSDISLDIPLMDTGLDSLSSVAFRNDLQKQLNMKLPASLIFDFPTARAIIDEIVQMSRSAR